MIPALLSPPLLLAAVLAVAAAAKWHRRDSLVSATRLLRLPSWLEAPVRWLPPIEAALAAGLVLAPWPPVFVAVAVATLGLMFAYLGVVARGLTMTPRPSCGCFGTIGAPITASTLLRNVVLTLVAVAALAWGLGGHTVPAALLAADAATWGWLLALVVAIALAGWVVADRAARPRATPPRSAEPPAVDSDDTAEDAYVREPIPPLMLVDGERPVTLAGLARQQAQLLVWVTCGCSSNREAVERADAWAAAVPQIGVRVVSTMTPEWTRQVFAGERPYLFDLEGQAFAALRFQANPAALLLGADGLLAGGPVWGAEDVHEFGEAVVAQLAEAELPQDAH